MYWMVSDFTAMAVSSIRWNMDGIFVFVKCRISLLRHFLIHRRRFEIMSNLLFPTKIPLLLPFQNWMTKNTPEFFTSMSWAAVVLTSTTGFSERRPIPFTRPPRRPTTVSWPASTGPTRSPRIRTSSISDRDTVEFLTRCVGTAKKIIAIVYQC